MVLLSRKESNPRANEVLVTNTLAYYWPKGPSGYLKGNFEACKYFECADLAWL